MMISFFLFSYDSEGPIPQHNFFLITTRVENRRYITQKDKLIKGETDLKIELLEPEDTTNLAKPSTT